MMMMMMMIIIITTPDVFSLHRSFGSCRGRWERKEVKPGPKVGTCWPSVFFFP